MATNHEDRLALVEYVGMLTVAENTELVAAQYRSITDEEREFLITHGFDANEWSDDEVANTIKGDVFDDEELFETFEFNDRCPACGDPIDYCAGHGEAGDPVGAMILDQHDDDVHDNCHLYGCPYVVPFEEVQHA